MGCPRASPAPAGLLQHAHIPSSATSTSKVPADEEQMPHRPMPSTVKGSFLRSLLLLAIGNAQHSMCKAEHRHTPCAISTASTLPVITERAGVPRRSQLADVILSVGDQQILAHGCVLCVWSEVFKALLTRWSAQRTDNGAKAAAVTVDLSPGDSPEDFLELLHFCYVGTCQVRGYLPDQAGVLACRLIDIYGQACGSSSSRQATRLVAACWPHITHMARLMHTDSPRCSAA